MKLINYKNNSLYKQAQNTMSARLLQILLLELFPSSAFPQTIPVILLFSNDEDNDDFYGDGFYGDEYEDDVDEEDEGEGNWFDNEDEWDNY